MQNLTKEQFEKKYGTAGLAQFNETQNSGFFDRLKQSAGAGLNQIKAGASQISNNRSISPLGVLEGALKVGAGAVNTAFSPVTAAIEPITQPTIGKAVGFLADKISDNKSFQNFANSKAGHITERVAEDVNNLNTIASIIPAGGSVSAATKSTGRTVGRVGERVGEAVDTTVTKAGQFAEGSVIKDIIPNKNQIINNQITKALDLNATDVRNIALSTGNDVGEFMINKKLVGDTLAETKTLTNDFFKKNYDAVRSEINAVDKTYTPATIPRYTQALDELTKQIYGVAGLEKSAAEIRTLIKKPNIKLSDVQRVKELIDDHYDLYKVTGDVKEGVTKQGLDTIRKDLRSFIEEEVKKNGGEDIAELNNNVATSKEILKAAERRSTRGFTRSNISAGDVGTFLSGSTVNPLLGAGMVVGKKIMESPSVRLRTARWLSGAKDELEQTLNRR